MKKRQVIRLTEGDLHNIIRESVNNILMEKRGINSQKLYDILQQHGGVEHTPGQQNNFSNQHYCISPYCLDFNNMTDDDIIGVFDYKDIKDLNDDCPSCSPEFLNKYNIKLGSADCLERARLRDGKYLLAILRGGKFDRRPQRPDEEIKDGDFEKSYKKTERRRYNRPNTYQDTYHWENEDARDLFQNPYFRSNSGNWTRENRAKAMDRVRNLKK